MFPLIPKQGGASKPRQALNYVHSTIVHIRLPCMLPKQCSDRHANSLPTNVMTLQITPAQMLQLIYALKQVSHVGYRENIKPSLPVQAAIIDTRLQVACSLAKEQDRCAIR